MADIQINRGDFSALQALAGQSVGNLNLPVVPVQPGLFAKSMLDEQANQRKLGMAERESALQERIGESTMKRQDAQTAIEEQKLQIEMLAKLSEQELNKRGALSGAYVTAYQTAETPEEREQAKQHFIQLGTDTGILSKEEAKNMQALDAKKAFNIAVYETLKSGKAKTLQSIYQKGSKSKTESQDGITITDTPEGGREIVIGSSKKLNEAMSASDVKQLDEDPAIMRANQDKLAALELLKDANSKFTTGPLAAPATMIGKTARQLGMPDPFNSQYGEVIRKGQEMFGLTQTPKTKGAISDKEYAGFQNIGPTLGTSHEANESIINYHEVATLRENEFLKFRREWLEKNKSLKGMQDQWDKFKTENPVFDLDSKHVFKVIDNPENISTWVPYLNKDYKKGKDSAKGNNTTNEKLYTYPKLNKQFTKDDISKIAQTWNLSIPATIAKLDEIGK